MMSRLPSGSLPGSTSRSTTETVGFGPQLILLGMGAVAVVLHVTLRFPLHLPGRQGLEWLALLLLARQVSPLPWAASITASGAAGLTMLFNPAGAPAYLATGLLVDLGWRYLPRWQRHALLLALLAGVAFAVKPLLQLGLEPFPTGQLGYRLLTHFVFGALGGLAGIGLWRARDRLRQR